jgi:hypothetical protein
MMRSMVIGTVALVLAGTVGAGARVSRQQADRSPAFAQPPQSGAINPGKQIVDKHNPRDGFIVVDEDTRLAYIKNATIWRPFDVTGADLSEGQSLGASKDGLPKTLLNDKVVVCDVAPTCPAIRGAVPTGSVTIRIATAHQLKKGRRGSIGASARSYPSHR